MTKARSNATAPNAKGTLVVGNGTDASTTLAVASTAGYLLTVDSAEATGLKWAAPASSALGYTLLNSGGTSLTGATTITISNLSGYNFLYIFAGSISSANASSTFTMRFNADSASNYRTFGFKMSASIDAVSDSSASSFELARMGTSAASEGAATVLVTGANSTGIKGYNVCGSATGTTPTVFVTGGYYVGTSVISSVSFISSTGNFDSGTVYIYGGN